MINLKTKSLIIVLLFIFQLLLLSCVAAKGEPQVGIAEDGNINNQIYVKVFDLMNTLETVNPVFLEIQSNTSDVVVFKNNFNVRIFQKTNNGWKEIKEKPTTRLPEDDVFFSPEKGLVKIFSVFPDLDDYTRDIYLRIYVIGEMQADQGAINVAAYTDVNLHP